MAPDSDAITLISNSGYEIDWDRFVQTLARLMELGLTDREISKYFADKSITWVGRITKLALTRPLSQAIDLGMDTPRVDMRDGRYIRANHIVLHFRDDVPDIWHQRAVGDVVKFEAQFKNNVGVQPAIGLSTFEGRNNITLRLGLYKGTLLDVIKY